MTGAGSLREMLEFQGVVLGDDGFGNQVPGGFGTRFVTSGSVRIMTGSETVIAGALTGVQTLEARVRWQPAMKDVTSQWRLRDARSKQLYDIASFEPDERKQWCRILLKKRKA